jgi:hypothetical protein
MELIFGLFKIYMIVLGLGNYFNNKVSFNLYRNLNNTILDNLEFYLKELFRYEIRGNKSSL